MGSRPCSHETGSPSTKAELKQRLPQVMGEADQKATPPRTCQSDPMYAELLTCCWAGAKAVGQFLPPLHGRSGAAGPRVATAHAAAGRVKATSEEGSIPAARSRERRDRHPPSPCHGGVFQPE